MMLRPAIGELLHRVGTSQRNGTRFSLVVAVAKRARGLNVENANANPKTKPNSYVTQAIEEIHKGEVKVLSNKKTV